MILVDFTPDGGDLQRLSIDNLSLEHKWRRGFVSAAVGSIGWALTQRYGGMRQLTYGDLVMSPDRFAEAGLWPPPKSGQVRMRYTQGTEAEALELFAGYVHLSAAGRDAGIAYKPYMASPSDAKIDSTAWSAINNDSLVNVITALCGADYLQLSVNSTHARNASPNVNYTFDTEWLCIDLVTRLAEFYSHIAYIDSGVLHLVDMFADNGDEIALGPNVDTSEIVEYAPVSSVRASGGNDWEIVAAGYPYGTDITVTPYHDTEANALVELNLIKAIIDGDIARVTLPLDKLPAIPVPGQPVSWADRSWHRGLAGRIRALDLKVDLASQLATITGLGDVGAPAVEAGVITLGSGEAWSRIIDNGETGYSTAGTWANSTTRPGYYGTNYQYCTSPSVSGKTATWTFNLPSTGRYRISASWSYYTDRPTNAPYTIKDNATEIDTVEVDQTQNPNGFTELGVADFGTTTCVVELASGAGVGGTYLTADAIKIEKTTAAATLPASTTYTSVLEETVQSTREQVGDATDRIWAACAFVAPETTTIRRIVLSLQANGSPTQDVTVEIWSDDGDSPTADAPSTLISAATTTLDASTLTSSLADYTFDGISAAITNGTKYWIVVKASAVNASNYVWWGLGTSGTTNRLVKGSSVPAWVNEGNYTGNYKLYKTA